MTCLRVYFLPVLASRALSSLTRLAWVAPWWSMSQTWLRLSPAFHLIDLPHVGQRRASLSFRSTGALFQVFVTVALRQLVRPKPSLGGLGLGFLGGFLTTPLCTQVPRSPT